MKTRRIFVFIGLIIMLMALSSCKPIAYYLERVYKVYGTVTDGAVGLESVEVFISGYQYSELTNGLGDYELELAEGTWTLDFVKAGYAMETRKVTVNAQKPRERMDVVLTCIGFGLSGEWASPDGISVPDGTFGYLKLVASGGLPTDQALYWTQSTAFSGGAASYYIAGIATGSYTAYAFIDMNNNASNSAAAFPGPGDWVLQTGKQITISDDLATNFESSGWVQIPAAALSLWGTWVNPEYTTGPQGPPGMIVITEETMTWYRIPEDDPYVPGAAYDIEEQVGDFYKIKGSSDLSPTGQFFILFQVSEGNTLEVEMGFTEYPPEIGEDIPNYFYAIYSRQ